MKKQSKYFDSVTTLSKNRSIFLYEDVNKDMSSILCSLLLYFDSKSNEQINLYINSNGGDTASLFQIYDVMQMIKSPISTICIGKAYSAAAVILAAGTKGLRKCFYHGNVMIHGVQLVFPVLPEHDSDKSEEYLKFVDSMNENMLAVLAKHSGQTIDKVREDCKRDLFLDSNESINYGIVDCIYG